MIGKIKIVNLFPKPSGLPEALKWVGITAGSLKKTKRVNPHIMIISSLPVDSNILSSGESETLILGRVSIFKL